MPPDASKTKAKLLDSAARAFASDGVFNASLIGAGRWNHAEIAMWGRWASNVSSIRFLRRGLSR